MNPLLLQLNTDIDNIVQDISTAENAYLALNGKYYQSKICGNMLESKHINIVEITEDLPVIEVTNNLPLEIEVWEHQLKDERGFTVFFRTKIDNHLYVKTYGEGLGSSKDWYEVYPLIYN